MNSIFHSFRNRDKFRKSLKKFLIVSVLLLINASFFACARLNYIARFEKKGQVVDTAHLTEEARKLKKEDVANVNAYVIEFPPGINWDGHTLRVDEKKWEVLGTVHSDYDQGSYIFWFYDYLEEESWKNTYCHVQVPINWITLGIWAFTPLYYPCLVRELKDDVEFENSRKLRITNSLKKITKIAGGDTVLVEGFGDLRIQFINTSTGQNVGAIGIKTVSGSGWALKKKK
ncbi:hypothetical protein CH379_019480 [Leptospira ellisii]|uniref:Uncharacterized protein n=1 Tax=Leptospira ellisii TaxID=2023197 RepID=A0AAE4U214_9LEPT|nr:hypothetical protein [Leptospira ellisii]MDV6237815.1 hypothetical protein [Leptospira ellisii]